MKNTNDYKIEITTGQYITAPLEQKSMIQNLFGKNVEYDFEIYFHWYNMIHELGHAIFEYNCSSRPHPVDEEQLVNDFAVAYWQHYGEAEKLDILSLIVHKLLEKFIVPAQEKKEHIAYAKEHWHTEEFFTFNNYGWFQFSCVRNSISRNLTLKQALLNIGVTHVQYRKKMILHYDVDDWMPYKVIKDATKILSSWGVLFPKEINVILSDNPNCHMCQSKPV